MYLLVFKKMLKELILVVLNYMFSIFFYIKFSNRIIICVEYYNDRCVDCKLV